MIHPKIGMPDPLSYQSEERPTVCWWPRPSREERSMKAPFSAVVLFMLAPCVAFGARATVPKRAPEIQKLGYYVGSWEGHGETKAGPFSPAGTLWSKQTCEWFKGGFQVVCRGEEHGPTGLRAFLNLLSYDQIGRAS